MVSVIIPTFNRANVIGRAIESVLQQTYTEWELLIVDDGSLDNTRAIVESFQDDRIRYIRCEERKGANAARNIGIQNAKGEFIAFQDSDDAWRLDKLEKQMKLFAVREDLGVVYSRYILHAASGECTLIPSDQYGKEQLSEKILHTLAHRNVVGTPTMVARKECFEECGSFDEAVPRFQDWELCIRLAEKYSFDLVDEPLMDAYEMEQSISKANYTAGVYIFKKHISFFKKHGTWDNRAIGWINMAIEQKDLEDLRNLIGEELFYEALYLYGEKRESIRKNYSFLRKWFSAEAKSERFNSLLEGYTDGTVVIYGMGDLGHLVLGILTKENKRKIKFVIDRNVDIEAEYDIHPLEALKEDDFRGIECIIITAVAHEQAIREKLDRITGTQKISLNDIIQENHYT